VAIDRGAAEGRAEVLPYAVRIILSIDDLSSLDDRSRERVALRREWRDASGARRRALIVVEVDLKGERPTSDEAWLDEPESG
jgi:hypothetical protein